MRSLLIKRIQEENKRKKADIRLNYSTAPRLPPADEL